MAILGIWTVKTDEELQAVHAVAASDKIKLMVTVDTNRALEEGKSRRPEKGNAPKPTLDWASRVTMLAAQSIPTPGAQRINLVDYITRHGPDCCLKCNSGTCANEDNALMVARLKPDLVVVSQGSTRTIADISGYIQSGLLPNTELVIINERSDDYYDRVLGDSISTTSIINRVRS